MSKTIIAVAFAAGFTALTGCGAAGADPEAAASGEDAENPGRLALAMRKAENTPPEQQAPEAGNAETEENQPSGQPPAGGEAARPAAPAGAEQAAAPAEVKVVEVTANDQMQFSISKFEVTAGQPVRIKLTNIGSLPKAAMGHNMVILKKGFKIPPFAMAANQAVANDYIPQGEEQQKKILAHTKLLGPGQTDTIEFTAPSEPGIRKFLCSFPAHYVNMQGEMTVKPAAAGGEQREQAQSDAPAPAEPEAQGDAPAEAKVVEVAANDQMQFSIDKFEVTAGQPVRIKLTNVGSLPKAAMGHNMVILKKGFEIAPFAMAANQAVANDYIPQGEEQQAKILAHTKLLGPGQTDTIEFTAPSEPGIRKFLCSFPAHYVNMQGDMVVKPAK